MSWAPVKRQISARIILAVSVIMALLVNANLHTALVSKYFVQVFQLPTNDTSSTRQNEGLLKSNNTTIPTRSRRRHLPTNTTIRRSTNITSIISGATATSRRSSKDKKAFVCITGQVNRLILSRKIESILDPLHKAGYRIHVGLVLTKGKAYFTNECPRNTTCQNAKPEFESYEEASEYLSSRGFKVVTPKPIVAEANPTFPKQYLAALGNWRNDKVVTKQFKLARAQNHARIYKSLVHCHEAMISTRKEYSIVVRVRDDVALEPPLDIQAPMDVSLPDNMKNNSTIFVSDCRMWGGINDRFAIVQPGAAKRYFIAPHLRFQLLTQTNTKALKLPPSDNLLGLNPEKYLKDTYQKVNLTIVATTRLRGVYKYHTISMDSRAKNDTTVQVVKVQEGSHCGQITGTDPYVCGTTKCGFRRVPTEKIWVA